jgi:hypothetical protein
MPLGNEGKTPLGIEQRITTQQRANTHTPPSNERTNATQQRAETKKRITRNARHYGHARVEEEKGDETADRKDGVSKLAISELSKMEQVANRRGLRQQPSSAMLGFWSTWVATFERGHKVRLSVSRLATVGTTTW